MDINFSFIIPHRNSPDLLLRCIKSIPYREDVEIIVVDDNSDEDTKPSIHKDNITVVLLDAEQSNGAGHARNMGIMAAKGKWLLFADADDTYSGDLLQFLDKIIFNDSDVIYFNYYIVNKGEIHEKVLIGDSKNIEEEDFILKYNLRAPWNKIVKKSFLKDNEIWFEESPVGNDMFFTYQVGFFVGNNYDYFSIPLYYYYITEGSITHKKKHNTDYYMTICKHVYQSNAFFKYLGHPEYCRSFFTKMVAILAKKGLTQFVLILKIYITHFHEIIREKSLYIDSIDKRKTSHG